MKSLLKKDLLELGKEAFNIKKQLYGDDVFFVRNVHLNYTNICVNHCRFCAFAKDEGEDNAYEMSVDDVLKYLSDKAVGCVEVHIVGGLHPSKPFEFYLDMIQSIKQAYPFLTIKAFSAVEIDYFSRISGLSIDGVFDKLKLSGLEMLPGGGAEILDKKIRNQICPEKIDADRWLYIMESAHNNGIRTNATVLYGHLETEEDILEHLLKIKKLQDKTGGFSAFIPLSFHPENTFLSERLPVTGVEDLRVIALSRIVLDNIPHIKAYWVMLGEKTAQVALNFGADDLDGTIVKEKITHAAGAKSKEGLTIDELAFLIKSAGFNPVERDAFYNEIKRY
ncbi:aminofutalosine synthase MqnE [Deferribacteraceae bacterium V6Fe1]|nr:aminofutalosine synthase MqnE [Deferribacteraceae bacterium V6Fe1]